MGQDLRKGITATLLAMATIVVPAGARASIFSHLLAHAAKHVAKNAVTNAVNNVNRRAAIPASKKNSPQTTYWSDYTRYRKPTGPNAAALRRLHRAQVAAARQSQKR